VAQYDIEFPRVSFFIGFEFLYLPENFYEVKISRSDGNKGMYIPALKGKIEKNKTTWVFCKGKWEISDFIRVRNKSITPAISLTLAN
jgi:hypothetical protein